MKPIMTAWPLAALLVAPVALTAPAHAQSEPAPVICGGPADDDDYEVPANDVSACEVEDVLVNAGNALGLIRLDPLIFGIVPRPVMSGHSGTWVDVEADPAGPAQEITFYEYAPDWAIPALREDVELANGERVIRVIKGDRAWNEGPRPGMNPMEVTDPEIIALRKARLWLSPHGIVRAAAFASKGLCPANDSLNNDEVLTCPENAVTINSDSEMTVTVDGMDFTVTLDPSPRGEYDFTHYVESIATTVNGMEIVRSFSDYANGKGTGDDDSAAIALIGVGDAYEIANATTVIDEYRFGVYYPQQITETVNGNTTLDVNISNGWTNRYVPFPDPELVLANQ